MPMHTKYNTAIMPRANNLLGPYLYSLLYLHVSYLPIRNISAGIRRYV